MDVRLNGLGRVVVYDCFNGFDVDPAGGDVCGNQDPLCTLKCIHHNCPLILALIAIQSQRLHPNGLQNFSHLLTLFFLITKYQHFALEDNLWEMHRQPELFLGFLFKDNHLLIDILVRGMLVPTYYPDWRF